MTRRGLIVLLVVLSAAFNAGAVRQGDRVTVRVDAASNRGPMEPIWAFFGYDEPNYTYMKDGTEAARRSWRRSARCRSTSARTTC